MFRLTTQNLYKGWISTAYPILVRWRLIPGDSKEKPRQDFSYLSVIQRPFYEDGGVAKPQSTMRIRLQDLAPQAQH